MVTEMTCTVGNPDWIRAKHYSRMVFADCENLMANVIGDFCAKTHHTVRKMFVLAYWDRKQRMICSDCILDCVTIMIHHDREWFERQIEEIKAHPPPPSGELPDK